MAKQYTAKEMREAACRLVGEIEVNSPVADSVIDRASEMLRQAADMMERKNDYEYAVVAKKHNGEVFLDTEHFGTLESAKENAEGYYDVIRYERREVGEWEEVPNDNN